MNGLMKVIDTLGVALEGLEHVNAQLHAELQRVTAERDELRAQIDAQAQSTHP